MDKIFTDEKGVRLDIFLTNKLGLTRSFIKNLIEEGKVLVNNKKVKAGYKLDGQDEIEIEEVETQPIDILPENLPLDIVYEDKDLAVINKQQGVVVHPAGKLRSGTLVNALLYHIKDLSGINGKIRPGIVHRIDKDTSGLIVVAKNDFAHLELQRQIQEKICKRNYLAVTYGKFREESGKIENYLARGEDRHEKIFVVPKTKGRYALTFYHVLAYNHGLSLVEFELKTGRTHQIRVHSSFLSHPIVGDKLYGKKDEKYKFNGQLLHAYKISFVHPRTKKQMEFVCKLPKYFSEFVTQMELYVDEIKALI